LQTRKVFVGCAPAPMSTAAFITYGQDKAQIAAEIANGLSREGLASYIPTATQQAGDFGLALSQAIMDSRCVVVVISPGAESSEAVRREIIFALNNGKTIVPVIAGDVAPESWLRLILDWQNQVDLRRVGLTPASFLLILNAVQAANATGRTVAMLNIKGGVGKTVLAANLFAAAHVVDNRSICFVDLDPQNNLSQYFLPPEERNRLRAENQTLFSVFVARGPQSLPREAFVRLPVALNRQRLGQAKTKLDLVIGDERLFEYTLDGRSERDKADAFTRFHALIAALRARYDAVVIDVNPCATFLTRCAISAADHIVAPVRPEKYSLTGLNMLEQVCRMIRGRTLRPSEFSVLLNGIGDRPRTRAGIDVDQATRDEISGAPFFGSTLLGAAIPYTVLLRGTPADKYAVNPINVTAVMRLAQRGLKENLAAAAAEILRRAGLKAP
jgi:chromosome partitioning protein